MRDVIFVLVTVGFFVLAGAYVTFCDRIARAKDESGAEGAFNEPEALEIQPDTQAPVGTR